MSDDYDYLFKGKKKKKSQAIVKLDCCYSCINW